MSIMFSFRYNSSSLRFGLIPWQFQNKMFKPMKVIKDTCHRWWCATVACLEDLGCLGTALVKLLGGEVDFKVMDGFEVVLVDEFTLVLVNVNGLGGGGGGGKGADRTYRFKQVFLSDIDS